MNPTASHLSSTEMGQSSVILGTPLPIAALITLAAVLIVVVYTELTRRKIPNWLTGSATGLGFLIAAFEGGQALVSSILGFLLGFGFFFVFWICGKSSVKTHGRRPVSGGDMKLMGAAGALLGFTLVQIALVYMAVLGALLAVGMLVWSPDAWTRVQIALRIRKVGREEAVKLQPLLVPYGLAIAGGCLLTLLVGVGR